MTTANSHKPPEIITRFAKHLSRIMADYLTNSDVGDKRHPLKDRLAVKIMLTLSEVKLYREDLLFRDYKLDHDELWIDYVLPDGKLQRLHTESIFYVQAVLGKRLMLVSKRKSLPTNLHFLLLMLCRYSLDNNWLNTRIKRKHEPASDINAAFFNPLAKLLKRQCQRLKTVSAVSATYRERYGVLYLQVGQNRAEMPEEISLFDVLEAVPIPLNAALKQQPVWYAPLLERILLSLNEGYGLLRACGLPPQIFGDDLSIGRLRELRHLKKAAEAYLKKGDIQSREAAYSQAFAALVARKKSAPEQNKVTKWAGFEDFKGFAGSEVGAKLLQTQFDALHTLKIMETER
ncbi:MAG: hypothetical protein HOP02_12810 [Methylococcaceae bacterium]|nr:hypothetical protein [Methylococcaceae bacterium]